MCISNHKERALSLQKEVYKLYVYLVKAYRGTNKYLSNVIGIFQVAWNCI